MAVGPGILVLVLVVLPALAVVGLLAALLAWAATGPAPDEPTRRARVRRVTTASLAGAVAGSLVVLLPGVLGVRAPALLVVVVLLAALVHLGVLRVGEAVAARPGTVRRSVALHPASPAPARRVLWTLTVGATALLVLAAAVSAALPPRLGGGHGLLALPLPAPAAAVTGAVLACTVALATWRCVRSADLGAGDGLLDPQVDASARARAVHRYLRAAASATLAALGATLLGPALLLPLDGNGYGVAVLPAGAGGLLLAVAAVTALWRSPALALRADLAPAPSDGGTTPTGAAV